MKAKQKRQGKKSGGKKFVKRVQINRKGESERMPRGGPETTSPGYSGGGGGGG